MKRSGSNKKRNKKYKGALEQSEKDKKKSKDTSSKSKFLKDKKIEENLDSTSILNPYFGLSNYLEQFDSLSRIVPVKNYLLPTYQNMETIKQAMSAYNNFSNLHIAGSLSTPMKLSPKWYSENIERHSEIMKNLGFSRDINTKLKSINFQNLSEISNYKATVESASKYIYYSQKSLSTFPFENIGNRINLENTTKSHIADSFTNLSNNFSDLLNSVKSNSTNLSGIIPIITNDSPREIYTGANLLETISGNEEITVEEEVLKKEIIYENEYSLNNYLPLIHTSLLKMWKGAIETFNSSNSDKVRHFTVSLRELFTQLMHLLAPNDEIKIWSTNPSDYHEGRPTRKARLSYICRNIQSEPFIKFVQSDIQTTIEFIDIFQKGTHGLENDFSQEQLVAMKSKAESTIKFLLEIEFSVNRL